MKQQFATFRISPEKQGIIDTANRVIADYQAQDLKLTLRQLYYQFIAQDLLPADWCDQAYNAKQGLDPTTKNTVKNYKKLGNIIADGRMAGLIDWEAIEDRGRQPRLPLHWDNISDLMDSALASYRLPRWKGQECYCELWVEKDALSGVLQPMAREFHVTLMVNKGYSSLSAMYDASLRFIEEEQGGKRSFLFYLGDHDPSGEDMVRDIQERLNTFGSEVQVQKLAITMMQIRQYSPPPNPAKMSDSRAPKYVEEHGDQSWEVDALPPEVLHRVVREAFAEYIDHIKMDEVKEDEERDKVDLRKAVASIMKKRK